MTRPGFTRANVVVVLVILGLIFGLIVIGVIKMQAAAASAMCSNNLKSIVLAAHGYHDNNNRLPPLVDLGDDAPTGRALQSAFSSLCPYIESYPWQFRGKGDPAGTYHASSSVPFPNTTNDGKPVRPQYGGDANQVWHTFLCPSDASARRLQDVPMTLPDGSTGYYAAGSYAANGLLPWNAGKFDLGPAATILFAERPQVCLTATGEAVHNLWGVGFYSPHMPAFAVLSPPGHESTGQAAPVMPLPDADDDLRVRIGTTTAAPQPVDFAGPFQRIRPGQACDPRLPGTPHRDGLQAAMTDGSVRTFAPDTSPRVFWAACVPSSESKK